MKSDDTILDCAECPTLTSLDISKWDTTSVTDMSTMFMGMVSYTFGQVVRTDGKILIYDGAVLITLYEFINKFGVDEVRESDRERIREMTAMWNVKKKTND